MMASQKRRRSPSLEVVDHRRHAPLSAAPMAPVGRRRKNTSSGHDKKIQDALTFADELLSTLPEASQEATVSELMQADMVHHVEALGNVLFQTHETQHSTELAKSVERQGRELWNTCVRLKRDQRQPPPDAKGFSVVSAARVLAFHLIAVGRETKQGRARLPDGDVDYLLNLAFSAAKSSVQENHGLARAALRRGEEYLSMLRKNHSTASTSAMEKRVGRLKAEHVAIKMTLAWREGRLDEAEQIFECMQVECTTDNESTELIAATLQLIGMDRHRKNDGKSAERWLKRARDVVSLPDELSVDGIELRLAIYQSLFQVLLIQDTTDALQEAKELVTLAEMQLGDEPVVLHWQLELLQKTSQEEELKPQRCASILKRMIRGFDGTEETFQFLLYHIKDLQKGNTSLATELLDELLLGKIIPSHKTDHIAKTLVRRVWLGTSGNYTENTVSSLQKLLDAAYSALPDPVGPDAAGAAQSLIWKKVDAFVAAENFHGADMWCQIGLHPVFASCGQVNVGKFHRKRLLCAIHFGDTTIGKQVFHDMSLDCQKNVLTSFLMFRLGLVSLDYDMMQQSLKDLGKCENRRQCQDMLYACIQEASAAGDKVVILAALKEITKSWSLDQVVTSNLPALLRCTIRMINTIGQDSAFEGWLNGKTGPDEAEDLCVLFEKGVAFAKLDPRDDDGNKIFTVQELDWFRKNAFNIGISKTQAWDLDLLIRIFETCVSFAIYYPKDIPLSRVTEITLMTMRCHFINAAALISLARTEDRVEEQLQRYVEVRQKVAAFDEAMAEEVESQREEVTQDLIAKAAALFAFDFEAAVALRAWDDLNEIVRKARICRDAGTFKAMGDCLLRSHASGRVLFGTLGLIINEIFSLEGFDVAKIAKYARCLFQAVLPEEDTLALSVLDQALQIAKEGKERNRPFPAQEMEWLVASTFNHAVDYFARKEEELCHRWALKAVELSGYVEDGGSLRAILQERLVRLQLRS